MNLSLTTTERIYLKLGTLLLITFAISSAVAQAQSLELEDPVSEFVPDQVGLTADFCQQWNPEFAFRGFRCCADPFMIKKSGKGRMKRKLATCTPSRARGSYCSEMTSEQKDYIEQAQSGHWGDLLDRIKSDLEFDTAISQAQCGPNNGFLVNGRPLVETPQNKVRIRNPGRCTQFGTDRMIGLIDWLGHEVAQGYSGPEYSKTRLVVGDISAPRGGCLGGRGGRRGHASHTNGNDADIAFLQAIENRASPESFHQNFDEGQNWWLFKRIFENPFACVQKIFLDKRWIARLAKEASDDPVWKKYHHVIQHVKFHRNHFHLRIGDHPGPPGCQVTDDSEPDDDDETDTASR